MVEVQCSGYPRRQGVGDMEETLSVFRPLSFDLVEHREFFHQTDPGLDQKLTYLRNFQHQDLISEKKVKSLKNCFKRIKLLNQCFPRPIWPIKRRTTVLYIT